MQKYLTVEINDFDVNDTNSVSLEIDLKSCELVSVFVFGTDGEHTTHELINFVSGSKEDETSGDFIKGTLILTGEGFIILPCTGFSFLKIKCSIAQGTESKVRILVNGFRNL